MNKNKNNSNNKNKNNNNNNNKQEYKQKQKNNNKNKNHNNTKNPIAVWTVEVMLWIDINTTYIRTIEMNETQNIYYVVLIIYFLTQSCMHNMYVYVKK